MSALLTLCATGGWVRFGEAERFLGLRSGVMTQFHNAHQPPARGRTRGSTEQSSLMRELNGKGIFMTKGWLSVVHPGAGRPAWQGFNHPGCGQLEVRDTGSLLPLSGDADHARLAGTLFEQTGEPGGEESGVVATTVGHKDAQKGSKRGRRRCSRTTPRTGGQRRQRRRMPTKRASSSKHDRLTGCAGGRGGR